MFNNPDDFKAWLESLPPQSVFVPRNSCLCPLASYARVTSGKPYEVSLHQYALDDEIQALPLWGWRFVLNFDASEKEPTRDTALEILESVMES